MSLIIGDLHGNLAKARAFLDFRPDEEHVCIGDYVDSFREPPERQLECLRLMIESEAVLLWGNHDIHYLPNPPWICSGFQAAMAPGFSAIFNEALKCGRMKASHAAGDWLCTHAGVHPDLVTQKMGTQEGATLLNHLFARQLQAGSGPLLNISPARGGTSPFGGIFWFDPFREKVEPSDLVGKQLFGHTELKEPHVTERWVCIDTTNAPRSWVFDTTSGTVVEIAA